MAMLLGSILVPGRVQNQVLRIEEMNLFIWVLC